MDRLLRPEKLETLPEDPDAAKVFKYGSKRLKVFYPLLQMLRITKECESTCPAN